MKRIRLFCFSYAGGSAQEFKRWEGKISPYIEIKPIVLPGHGRRLKEKLLESIEAMVLDAYAQIKDHICEKDYAFFGHSMGAIIAHELTNRIAKLGLPQPRCVFLSGREAPHLAYSHGDIYNLPERELRQRIAYYDGTPDEIFENPYLKQIFLPILLADLAACDTYQRQFEVSQYQPLEIEMVVMAGKNEKLSKKQLEGWQKFSKKEISLHYFSGGHFFINEAANIQAIADIINKKLIG